jgi:hypothetical protein
MSKEEVEVNENESFARRRLFNTLSAGLAGTIIGNTTILQAQANKVEQVVDPRVVKRTAQNISQL